MFRRIIHFTIPILYLITIFIVIATAKIDGYTDLLAILTKENGLYESLSVLWLFIIFIYGIYSLYTNRNQSHNSTLSLLIFLFSLLALLAVLEEISWGQHLLHFQSSDFFSQHNIQKETNLHNFVDANLFSSFIYASIYIFLVFIPLFFKIVHPNIKYLKYFDINLHYILIILFSSSLQIYFYKDFGVYMDMIAHLSALLLLAYLLKKEKTSLLVKLHYLIIVFATVIFMSVHNIFSFFNMQYEIREMFVTLGVLCMFMDFVRKEYLVR
jgi:hypothetical protein